MDTAVYIIVSLKHLIRGYLTSNIQKYNENCIEDILAEKNAKKSLWVNNIIFSFINMTNFHICFSLYFTIHLFFTCSLIIAEGQYTGYINKSVIPKQIVKKENA